MYIDTSVIVKLLVKEPETLFFQENLLGEKLCTSELSNTEVWSALLAKERNGQISNDQRKEAWIVFNEKILSRQITILTLDSTALKKANQCLESCHPNVPMRALDAIHIASCDLAQDFPLCTSDKRMREAAKILHIPVFPE